MNDRLNWLRNRLRDPVAVIMIAGVALVYVGFMAFAIGWHGAAATLDIPLQMPYLVSAGLGGAALIALGLGLCNLYGSRRETAREMVRLQDLLDEAAGLLEAVELRRRRAPENGSGPTPAPNRAQAERAADTRSPSTRSLS